MFSSENRGLLLKLVEVELIFLLFYVTETEIYVLYSYILICKEWNITKAVKLMWCSQKMLYFSMKSSSRKWPEKYIKFVLE